MKTSPATLLLGIAVGAVIVGAIVAERTSPAAPTSGGGSGGPVPAPPAPPVPSPPAPVPAPAPGKMRASDVAAAWSAFVVVDMAKYATLYNALPANAPLVAMGSAPVAQIISEDPRMTATVLGPVPTYIVAQLAQGNRVWVGTPQLDPTAEKPESVLPMYVGNTPPAGYIEVTS